MIFALRSALAAFVLVACSAVADACAMPAPFVLQDIRRADAVFTGRLAKYARIETGAPAVPVSYGLLIVDVEEMIKGRVPRRVELAWHNSTFGIPGERPTDVPLLIAAFRVEDDMPGPVWRVMQTPCAPPFLLDDTPRTRADVRKALRADPVPPHDYFALQRAGFDRLRAEAAEPDHAVILIRVMLGALGVAVAAFALARWWAARRRE